MRFTIYCKRNWSSWSDANIKVGSVTKDSQCLLQMQKKICKGQLANRLKSWMIFRLDREIKGWKWIGRLTAYLVFYDGGFPLCADGILHLSKQDRIKFFFNVYSQRMKQKLTVKTFCTTRARIGMKGSNNIWRSWSRLPFRVAGLMWKLTENWWKKQTCFVF